MNTLGKWPHILCRHLFRICQNSKAKTYKNLTLCIVRSHALKIASKDFLDCHEGNLPTTCVCFPSPPPRRAEAAATRRTLG